MTLPNFLGSVDLGQIFWGRAKKYLRTPGLEHRQTFYRNKQEVRCSSVLIMEIGPT